MKAVRLSNYEKGFNSLECVAMPLPALKEGQVLIQMAAASINPSDLAFMEGNYGFKKKLPVVPGFEGSGTVVAASGPRAVKQLIGKRVACAASFDGDGSWAQYMAVGASYCLPLKKNVDIESGSSILVNPLTAYVLIEKAKKNGHTAIVQTAAAGALGRMIYRLARREKLEVINIVRRSEQIEIMKEIGAEHVLNSSDDRFDRSLLVLAKKLNATAAFDAVGGKMPALLAATMPTGSTITVYGGLSGETGELHPGILIFKQQTIDGFWLSRWMGGQSPKKMAGISSKIQDMLKTELKTDIRARYPLDKFREALEAYSQNMSGGKVLLLPF